MESLSASLFITFAFSQEKEGEGRSERDCPVVFGVLSTLPFPTVQNPLWQGQAWT